MKRAGHERLSAAQRVLLFRQLHLLLRAGVLLADALRCLRDRFPDARVRRILQRVHAEVAQSRRPFSAALAQYPRSFGSGDLALVAAGEGGGSGQLADRLSDLADRIEYQATHRRALRRACAYPAAACGLAVGLVAFLAAVVMPRLEDLLHSLGAALPPTTRLLLAVARHGRGAGPGLAAAGGGAVVLVWLLRRGRSTAHPIDVCLLRVPFAGTLYREFTVALICKIYRSLYLSGQPAPAILDACTLLSGNAAVRARLRRARGQVIHHGARLSRALDETGLFPPLAILVLEVGEHSGQLAEAMDEISRHFHARATARLDAAIACLNPALTAAVVAGVGLVMLGFFQGMYQVVYAAQ